MVLGSGDSELATYRPDLLASFTRDCDGGIRWSAHDPLFVGRKFADEGTGWRQAESCTLLVDSAVGHKPVTVSRKGDILVQTVECSTLGAWR